MKGKARNRIKLFEDKRVRMAWDSEKEDWLFSIVDVVGVLTEQQTPRSAALYWGKMKATSINPKLHRRQIRGACADGFSCK